MLMEILSKESGMMIRQMATEYIHIQMVRSMKGIGRMIYNMGKEKKSGQMEADTKVNIEKEKSMVKVFMFGQMEVLMMENGLIIK